MSNELEIGLDGSPLEQGVRGVVSALNELRAAVATLDNLPANKVKQQLAGISTAIATVSMAVETDLVQMVKKVEDTGKKTGRAHAKGIAQGMREGASAIQGEMREVVKRVQAEQVGMFSPYNARTVLSKELKDVERATVATWKSIYRHRNKLAEQAERDQRRALNSDLAGYQQMLKLRTASEVRAAKEASAAQDKALKDDLAGYQNMLRLRAAAQARAVKDDLAGYQQMLKLRTAAEVDAAKTSQALSMASLSNASKAMWAGKAGEQAAAMTSLANATKAMWKEKSERESEEAARYKSKLDLLNARVRQAHQDESDRLDKLVTTLGKMSKSMWKEKAEREKVEADAFVRSLDVINAKIKAAHERQAAELEAAAYKASRTAKAMVNQSMVSPAGAYSTLQSGTKFGTVVQPKEPAQPMSVQAQAARALATEMARAGTESARAALGIKSATVSLNDMHSAARGVASGFNAMWLTWGNIAPLLVGAALSNAFVQSIKKGAEFEHTLTKIEVLAGESKESIGLLREEALALGEYGPMGPNEMAKAMKALALAGLDAKQQLQSISAVRNFAIAGDMDVEKAAESLVAIATAYGYSAKDFAVVADVVAKTASSSMASIESMTESFKQASVVAQQYGVTLTDTSTTLALLSQIGIQGSSAGTAMRNMYNELMGSSKMARRVLEETLKVDVWDNAAKAMKPLPQIMGELLASLSQFDSKSQQGILRELGNERGTKALAANLAALQKQYGMLGAEAETQLQRMARLLGEAGDSRTVQVMKEDLAALQGQFAATGQAAVGDVTTMQRNIVALLAKKDLSAAAAADLADLRRDYERTSKTAVNEFVRMQAEIQNSAGYTAVAAAQMAQTTQNLLKSVGTALETSLIKAFQSTEPAVQQLSVALRNMISSEEFVRGISALAGGVASLGQVLLDHKDLIVSVGKAYLVYKAAAVGLQVTLLAMRGVAALSGVFTALQTAVIGGAAALRGAASASMVLNSALMAIPGVSAAAAVSLRTLHLAMGGIGLVLAAVGAAWALYQSSQEGSEESHNSLVSSTESLVMALKDEEERLDQVAKARDEGVSAMNVESAAHYEHVKNTIRNNSNKVLSEQQAARAILVARKKLLEANNGGRPGTWSPALQKIDGQLAESMAEIQETVANTQKNLDLVERVRIKGMTEQTRAMREAESAGRQKLTGDQQFNDASLKNSAATNTLTVAIKNNVGALAAQGDALAQSARAQYDSAVRLLESRNANGLVSEGAYQAQLTLLTAQSEAARVAIAARSNEEIVAEHQRVAAAYETQAALRIASSKLTGQELADFRKSVGEDLHEKLASLEDGTRAAVLKNAAEIVGVVEEAAQRRQLAEDRVNGAIKKAREEAAQYWEDNNDSRAREDAVYRLEQAYKDVGEGSVAWLKAEKAASETALAVAQQHEAQLKKLTIAARELAVATADAQFEADWAAATVGGADAQAMQKLADSYKLRLLAAEETLKEARRRAGEDVASESAKAYGRAMEAEIDRLKAGVADSIVTALFEGGQAGKKKLRDLLVAELRKPLTLVVNVLVNSLISSFLGPAASGAGGAAGSASGALSMAQMASNAYSAITGSTWFSNFGGSVTNLINQAGGKLFNAGLEQLGGTLIDFSNTYSSQITQFANVAGTALAAFQGFKSLSDGNYAGAAGSAIGYVLGGPLGASIGNFIGSALNETLFGNAGTAHTGGAGSYSTEQGSKFAMRDSALGFGADAYSQATAQASSEIAKSAVLALEGLSAMFGSDSKFWVGTGFADDTSSDGAWGALKVVQDGNTVLDWGRGADKWPGREFANGAAGQEQYLQAVATDLRNLLKTSAPAWADDILDAIEGTVTLEKLGTALAEIQGIQQAFLALGNAMPQLANLSGDATTSLLGLAGGISNLQAMLGSYYENFYSEAERLAAKESDLQRVFQTLGVAMPTTRAGFRELVEAQDLTTESGRRMYTALLNLAPTFAEITAEVGNATNNILQYVDQLRGNRAGLATPTQQLQYARDTYLGDLGKARGGDAEAMGRITESASAYIEAQKTVTASSSFTQAVIDQIAYELSALAGGGTVPQFAAGGYHKGGWAVVGEEGPELAYFGAPARIYNAQQSTDMMNTASLLAEIRALRMEVTALRQQQGDETRAVINSDAAVQQAVAERIVEGVASAGDRAAWRRRTEPVLR